MMDDKEIKSLIILDRCGKVLDLGEMNEKAYKKSLESGSLWIFYTDTGRVLPYKEGVSVNRLERAPFGYMVYLEEKVDIETAGEANSSSSSITIQENNNKMGSALILPRLADVISRRHEEMPEGSYTTHLFQSGADKIRKKLGEEAVEVILARGNKEIIYESADLIYHLLVLLESENIPLDEVFSELEKRG